MAAVDRHPVTWALPIEDQAFYQLEILRLAYWGSGRRLATDLGLVDELINGEMEVSPDRLQRLIGHFSRYIGVDPEGLSAAAVIYGRQMVDRQVDALQKVVREHQAGLWWGILRRPSGELVAAVDCKAALLPGDLVPFDGGGAVVMRTPGCPRPFLETLAIGAVMRDWAKRAYLEGNRELAYRVFLQDPAETPLPPRDFLNLFAKLDTERVPGASRAPTAGPDAGVFSMEWL